MEFIEVQKRAEQFLKIADELHDLVSAYIDGSYEKAAEDAHEKVMENERYFLDAYNEYYDENNDACLNYELAEYVL